MQVSFPPKNLYNQYNYNPVTSKQDSKKVQHTQTQIEDAKVKKSISECFYVVLGFVCLYFVTKVKGKQLIMLLKKGDNGELSNVVKEVIKPVLP